MEEIRNYLNNIRREFITEPLEEDSVDKNPVKQFGKWLESAIDSQILDPYAMVLSTVSEMGNPSGRVVYLRDVSEKGFIFYTNYKSAKSKDIMNNPGVSMLFHWAELERQVRITGKAEKVKEVVSNEYFAGRPRESQIGAWASEQSSPIDSRSELEEKVVYYEEKFKEFDVPRPEFWGGFIVKPSKFEFWQGRPGRLHDRIVYDIDGENWKLNRLSP